MIVEGLGLPCQTGRNADLQRLTIPGRGRDTVDLMASQGRKPLYQKLYRLSVATTPDPATQVLRDELQASRLPFQSRLRRPLTPDVLTPQYCPVLRCRPVLSRPTTAHGSGSSLTLSPAPHAWRPRSTPAHGQRTPHPSLPLAGFSPHPPPSPHPGTPRVDPGHFDTLSPRILSQLLSDVRPRPFSACYGDRILTRPPRRFRERREPKPNLNDDISTTSGIESDGGEEEEEDADDADVDDSEDEEDEEEDSSDSEDGGFEPSLDDLKRQLPHPQSLFPLRPEKLDAFYVPEDKRDMRRFDFDAARVEVPAYDFKSLLPDSLSKVSLRLCAREGTDWQDYLPGLPPEGRALKGVMDRLVEMEKYQLVTRDWEAKKLRGQLRRQERLASGWGARAASARARDRRCCGLCLQAACVGDCPEKRPAAGRCDKCRQPLCTGACQDSRYEQRMRQARSSDSLVLDEPPPPPPPRSPSRGCHSCLRRHTAKLINANQLLLGRPKSSHATYARGQSSCRPKDLRPKSAVAMHSTLVKDFERLGIEPQQATPPAKSSTSRPRSRNGLLPGKSSRSNRKNSISDSGPKKRKRKLGRSVRAAQNAS